MQEIIVYKLRRYPYGKKALTVTLAEWIITRTTQPKYVTENNLNHDKSFTGISIAIKGAQIGSDKANYLTDNLLTKKTHD